MSRSKKFTPIYPESQSGKEFSKWFWNQNQGWDWIRGNAPTPEGEKTQWMTESYPVQPDELWSLHQEPGEAIGVSFKEFTRYALLDLDRGSAYHPVNNQDNYEKLLETLRSIGLMQPVVLQSTWSGGLHLYYPFPKKISSFGVACAIKWCLFDVGIFLQGGQVESFPNVKSYAKNNFTEYKAHRLPLQSGSGSALLDGMLEPYSERVEDLLDEFDQAARQQNLELLKSAIAQCRERQRLSRGHGSNQRADRWKQHLEARLAAGWTAVGQTNSLLKDIATYGRVFLGLDGQILINYVIEQSTSAAGYERYCNHQHEIRRRASDWCKSVELYYWPYGSTSNREGTYRDHFSDDCPSPDDYSSEPEICNNIVDFPANSARSAQAEERIKKAIAVLEERGELPQTATARATAIIATAKELSGVGVSLATLNKPKYLPLWHPKHDSKPCVITLPKPVSAVSEEAKAVKKSENLEIVPKPESLESASVKDLSENYTSPSHMKGLGGSVPSDAPQAQSEEHIATEGGTGGHPQLQPSEFARMTSARLRAAGLAREAIKLARLSSAGTDAERREAERLAGETARMQCYWASGIDQLRREAREWAALNPGILPEIPPALLPPLPKPELVTVQPAPLVALIPPALPAVQVPRSTPLDPRPVPRLTPPSPGRPWYADRLKPREQEPSPFQIGQRVRYEGEEYVIRATTHTHSQLEGLAKAVPNFCVTPVTARERVPLPGPTPNQIFANDQGFSG